MKKDKVEMVTLDTMPEAVRDAIRLANEGYGFISCKNREGKVRAFPARFEGTSGGCVPFKSALPNAVTYLSIMGLSPLTMTEEQLGAEKRTHGWLDTIRKSISQISTARRGKIVMVKQSVRQIRDSETHVVSEQYLTDKPNAVMEQICSARVRALADRKAAKAIRDGTKLALLDVAGHKSAAAQDRAKDKAEAKAAIAETVKEVAAKGKLPPITSIVVEEPAKVGGMLAVGKVSAKAAKLAKGISPATIAAMAAPLGKSAKVNLVSGKVSKVSRK